MANQPIFENWPIFQELVGWPQKIGWLAKPTNFRNWLWPNQPIFKLLGTLPTFFMYISLLFIYFEIFFSKLGAPHRRQGLLEGASTKIRPRLEF